MSRQLALEPLEQKLDLSPRLGVAGKHQFATVTGGDVYIEHLHGGEFVEHTVRRSG